MLLPIHCALLFNWPLQSRAQVTCVACTAASSQGGTLEAGRCIACPAPPCSQPLDTPGRDLSALFLLFISYLGHKDRIHILKD